MSRKLRKKKYIIILFIAYTFVIGWILFTNEFLIDINSKGENIKSKNLETIVFNNSSLHDLKIYVDRGQKIKGHSKINYHFSINISDKIGGIRQLPDTRFEGCKSKIYDIPNDITVTVIITYYNEARSTLLRTIVSVLLKTPIIYLKEIIVIDDFNDDVTQGIDLQFLPLIKLIRNKKRLGVIESRNIGAKLATSEYILFLDSHCEVNIGWLEPLLSRLYLYPGTGVSPTLDIINSKTFQYQSSGSYLKGGFDWKLNFNWIPMNEEEREFRIHNNDEINPFASPGFSGGIFMISKTWFTSLQGFNPLLKVWGGESIEMAIKLWLCGGQIEIVPCSRVGHVFMQEHSFDFPSGQNTGTYLSNVKVIVESWLDEYKHYFYTMKPKAINLPVPDLNAIRKLKTDLKCRPFSWYLRIIFPELKLPNEEYIAFGKITSGNKCLSIKRITIKNNMQQKQQQKQQQQLQNKLTMKNCQDTDVTDWYLHSTTGKLSTKSGTECLNVIKKSEIVVIEECIKSNNNNNDNKNYLVNFNSRNSKDKNKRIFSSSSTLNTSSSSLLSSSFLSLLSSKTEMGTEQRWIRSGEYLIHKDSQLCLDNFFKDLITVSLCRRGNPSQLFSFSVELQKL